MKEKTISIIVVLTLVIAALAIVPINVSAQPANPTVTKTASPSTINIAGSGGIEETTVTITVTGAGSEETLGNPLDVVFAIDSTGSMDWNDPSGLRRTAAKNFVDKMDAARDQGGVVSWDSQIDFTYGLTSDFPTLKSYIDMVDAYGDTNLNVGLFSAINMLDLNTRIGPSNETIIFLSDGDGIYNKSGTPESPADDAASKGYVVYTIGLKITPGSQAETDLMDIATTTGGQYFSSPDASSLDAIFSLIFDAFVENTIPYNVDVIEVTKGYIIDEGSFNPAPNSVVTVADITTITWLNIGMLNDGNPDLSPDETVILSFNAKSNQKGNNLEVDVFGEAIINFEDYQGGNPASVDIPQAFITVIDPSDEPCECCWDDHNCVGPVNTIANVVGTGSGGDSGGGDTLIDGAPIIKCKWEYDQNILLKGFDPCCIPDCVYHDACPFEPGLQVKPVLGEDVTVGYYAIVTDPQGVGHIDHVYADVWHPNGEFKYQFELFPIGLSGEAYDKTQALDTWNHVITCHADLITYGEWERPEGWTKDQDILDELEEEDAYLYYGERVISYCQPAGEYTVGIIAYDGLDMWCEYLMNKFWYIPTAAVEIDFDTVNYDDVVESVWQQVGGDKYMDTPLLPTVKNIGNVPVYFTITQDDMGFGKTGDLWNVEYKARLGKDGDFTLPYKPNDEAIIPGFLGMCIEEKFDFLIHVIKGFPDGIPNEGTMTICAHIHGNQDDWISPMEFDPAPLGIDQNILLPP